MSEKHVNLGPRAVSIYPNSAWNYKPGIKLQDAWALAGPTVQQYINRPLWEIATICYLEGMIHGVQGMAAMKDGSEKIERKREWRD